MHSDETMCEHTSSEKVLLALGSMTHFWGLSLVGLPFYNQEAPVPIGRWATGRQLQAPRPGRRSQDR